MIDRGHDLALATQADLLSIARSTLYRQPRPVPAADLAVMRRIDELHLNCPFAGSRMMRDMLVNEGIAIGRTHVRGFNEVPRHLRRRALGCGASLKPD